MRPLQSRLELGVSTRNVIEGKAAQRRIDDAAAMAPGYSVEDGFPHTLHREREPERGRQTVPYTHTPAQSRRVPWPGPLLGPPLRGISTYRHRTGGSHGPAGPSLTPDTALSKSWPARLLLVCHLRTSGRRGGPRKGPGQGARRLCAGVCVYGAERAEWWNQLS